MNKIIYTTIAIILIASAVFLVISGMRPEFFDIFGLIVFTFLFIVGILMLKSKKKLPDWVGFIILLIGISGLIVDGAIVIKTYLLVG